MKAIRLGEVASVFQNSKNKQYSLVLKSREMKKKKVTAQELLNFTFVKPKVKFGLKREKKEGKKN